MVSAHFSNLMKHNAFLILIIAALLPVAAFGQKSVEVAEAGTLNTLINETEKYSIEELTVTGPLNGSDLALLRDMAGCNSLGELTEGKLRVLDLSGATMVAGGSMYLDAEKITIDEGYDVTNGSTGFHLEAADNTIPEWAFAGCNSLQEIILPAGIEEIGTLAFFTLNLRKVNMPNTVKRIGARAFYHNIRLEAITLPVSLEEIGDRAFGYCSDATTVTALMPTPLPISEKVFVGVYETCTLQVPQGTRELYAALSPWNKFQQIEEIDVTGIQLPTAEHPLDIHSLNGHRIATQATTLQDLRPGVYVVNGSKVIVR